MEKTVAKLIVENLAQLGVRYTFGMPGSQTLELFDAMIDSPIRNILTTNELFASLMANGYSSVTGKPAVCVSIPGPGFTNMFTGLAQALVDSIPAVVLVVGKKTKGMSYQMHEIRQLEAVRPLVKDAFQITSPEQVANSLSLAFKTARSGEPGPVVIEVPEDLVSQEAQGEQAVIGQGDPEITIDEGKIREIVEVLRNSKLCGIYAGKGAMDASKELMELAEAISAPVATTASGKGIIPDDHDLAVGFGFGRAGSEIAEKIFDKCDALLAVGCKFSEFATAGRSFRMPENLIHIDSNEAVFDMNYKSRISLCSGAKAALKGILAHREDIKRRKDVDLIAEIRKGKKERSDRVQEVLSKDSVHPSKFFYELRKHIARDAILTVDCGFHQLWSLTDFEVFEPGTYVTSCDYQAMGFGIPAAIGAKLAHPKKDVVCVCGDGGFLMSGFELTTAKRQGLNIVVIIFNDGGLGLIRHSQEKVYGRQSSTDLVDSDFEIFAGSLGIAYVRIANDSKITESLKGVFGRNTPVIVDVNIRYDEEPRYYAGAARTLWEKLTSDEKLKQTRKMMERKKHGTL